MIVVRRDRVKGPERAWPAWIMIAKTVVLWLSVPTALTVLIITANWWVQRLDVIGACMIGAVVIYGGIFYALKSTLHKEPSPVAAVVLIAGAVLLIAGRST